jgi:predicted ATP-grasp superfamily ATP-dependent carboligase
MLKVLILDASQRSALAATRSLGKKGIHVIVADETQRTLAGSSKYCQESFSYPSPYEFPEGFITDLVQESIRRNIRVIFPMTELSTYLLLKHRDQFINVNFPFAPFEVFNLLTNKDELLQLADQLKIPVPLTYKINNRGELSDSLSQFKFPVVLKPYRSRIPSDGKWVSASVKYANSAEEVEATVAKHEYFGRYPFLLQEYIQGRGQGVFALYNNGDPVTFFAHRRLREKPPSGGVSVLSESVALDPRMLQMTQRILDHVRWHGVAMVEFKVALDGTPYLMEVNARFWGSLQLAVDSGVDFPYLLYQLATGQGPVPVNGYRVGIRNRWLLGDLDSLYLTFKNHSGQPFTPISRWQEVTRFLNMFEKETRYEVNRWDDLRPFLFELKQYLSG